MISSKPALAVNYSCLTLSIQDNRLISSLGALVPDDLSGTTTAADAREFCHDGPLEPFLPKNSRLIATRAIAFSNPDDQFWMNLQTYNLSEVSSLLPSCALPENSALTQFASILPQSPENARIPTIISKMMGEGSLAGNLAVELYSGIWQYLGVLTTFKLFKLIKG